MVDISDSFRFSFKDPDWVMKYLIGCLFSLLSIFILPIPVLYGYYIELLQKVSNNDPIPLPEWKDPGIKFLTGLKYITVMIIYYLPLLIILIPTFALFIIMSIWNAHTGNFFESGLFGMFIILTVVPYSIFIYLLQPSITILFSNKESMRDALNIGQVIKLFKIRWEDILVVSVLTMVFDLLAVVGILFFIIGIFFTTFFVQIIRFHMYGQIGRDFKKAQLI
ncbi:MAG: DUF4013 domain-containing protein [Ignavibacteriales bacterium]|nr:DUF4013 domain-containing protein [Ignavibacteriales bacterium]